MTPNSPLNSPGVVFGSRAPPNFWRIWKAPEPTPSGERRDRRPLPAARVVTRRGESETRPDEAYITYGFAKHLRDALPNASFIGFTGTPIELTDRSTPAVFGAYIDIYDIQRAVEDGATVRIYYEGRLAKLDLKEDERPKIDPEFVDIFAAAGLKTPDISILSDEFLAEVRAMPQKNLALELLRKLLNDDIRAQAKKNLIRSRSFAEMLERTIRQYQNRSIEAAQVITQLIELAKEMRAAHQRGGAKRLIAPAEEVLKLKPELRAAS